MSIVSEITASDEYGRAVVDVTSAQAILSNRHPARFVHLAAVVSGIRLARTHYPPSELAAFLRDMADSVDREVN